MSEVVRRIFFDEVKMGIVGLECRSSLGFELKVDERRLGQSTYPLPTWEHYS